MELSPKNIINSDADNNILVKLIGDFLPADLFPRDLSDKYLLIPSSPPDHINVRLGTQRWMLVDKTQFSLDGNECDKIGVGFFAFNSQSERCNIESGSCLNNQIYHLFQQDIERLQVGKNPEYLLKYDKNYDYSFYANGLNSRSFSYYLRGNLNTLITLEINTDILKFVTNVSSGKIINIFVKDFEAMSDDGYMQIGITNTGFLTAQYIISYDCNENIISLSSDEISLQPEETKYLNKSIYTISKIGEENKCVVFLKNALNEQIDMKFISFNTTSEIQMNNFNLSNNIDKENVISGQNEAFNCEILCTKIIDFNCYFKNSCYGIMAKRLLIIISVIVIGIILFKYFKKIFCCCKIFSCCFCCCDKKKNKKNKVKSSYEDSSSDYIHNNKKEIL